MEVNDGIKRRISTCKGCNIMNRSFEPHWQVVEQKSKFKVYVVVDDITL